MLYEGCCDLGMILVVARAAVVWCATQVYGFHSDESLFIKVMM